MLDFEKWVKAVKVHAKYLLVKDIKLLPSVLTSGFLHKNWIYSYQIWDKVTLLQSCMGKKDGTFVCFLIHGQFSISTINDEFILLLFLKSSYQPDKI